MAREVWSFQVSIPAGTPQITPVRISTTIPIRRPEVLQVIVPPGPAGSMGFAITMGGVNVIPVQPGAFLVTDNERIEWPLTDLPTSGAWQVSGYNTGNFAHSIFLRWLVDVVQSPSAASPLSNISLDLLSST